MIAAIVKVLALAALLVVAAPKAAAANPPSQTSVWPGHKSGIRGHVFLRSGPPYSPTFLPIQTTVAVFTESGLPITTIDTDQNGAFEVGLKRGTYLVVIADQDTVTLAVEHKEFTEITRVYMVFSGP